MGLSKLKRLICTVIIAATAGLCVNADSIPDGFSMPLCWNVVIEAYPAYVLPANSLINGDNQNHTNAKALLSGDIDLGFTFSPKSRQGQLYPNASQGIGIGSITFSHNDMFGSPVAVYVYQTAPIKHFSQKLWLSYKWKFGAAIGWKHQDNEQYTFNNAVSTNVTALMDISLRVNYQLTDRITLAAGVEAVHFSNGNTSLPNRGVNSIGPVIGAKYHLGKTAKPSHQFPKILTEADSAGWFFDIMAYGAWRKKAVILDGNATLCPGKFGVAGLRLSPVRRINRWFALSPSLDMQYDESADLASHWVEGSSGDDIKFYRPPFYRQLSFGLSANAEFTMPIFTISAGLGYDFIKPDDDRHFYQQLTLKTFVTDRLYLNVGYRLGRFKDPQNLMLGLGIRF